MDAEILQTLYGRTTRGVKFDLARMRQMCEAAGHPERCAPSVLIAGTNGKGSVASMWATALQAAGRRTGLYTSPHLVRFSERIRIGGVEIADGALSLAYDELVRCEAVSGLMLTFFEAATFMAFVAFREAGVEAMVLEVGMGGRLDATNVVDPSVCVITTIGLDHEEFLGAGEAAIAGEKAGILRAGVPAAVGRVSSEAFTVIGAKARELGTPLTQLGDIAPRPVALAGSHQQHNAALFALSASLVKSGPLHLDQAAIDAGFAARWPGRYDVRSWKGIRVILDGAHNPPAYAALVDTLKHDAELAHPRVLLFGATEGRAHAGGLKALAMLFDEVVLCPPDSPRAVPVDTLAQTILGAHRAENVATAFEKAEKLAARSICLTGSLYLVGDALSFLEGRGRDTVADFR